MSNPTTRFSDRVDNYIKYRPSYPVEILEVLRNQCGLTPDALVADIGSGTGILTKLLLESGNKVFAVEPNQAMREAAEKTLGHDSNFCSVAANAEASKLDTASIDLVVCAQAFHWFDREKAKVEFSRILKSGGWAALIWNARRVDSSPFLANYESLLKEHATDYNTVNHMNINGEIIDEFFSPASFAVQTFPNYQHFDYEALKGRCLSSSYIPSPGSPGHDNFFLN